MTRGKTGWTVEEKRFLDELDAPIKVQDHLDRIQYDSKKGTRSPRWVMKEKAAHCFEGALFAAACLRNMGYPPLILDLRAYNDDDHVIAVYRKRERLGCIAKSNFTTIRYREPVYRSLRELAMSFFDLYFNSKGEKTLRQYSVPLDLSRFDDIQWMTTDEDLDQIGDALDRCRHYDVIDPTMVRELSPVSPSLLEAGLIGSDPKGLFEPE